MQERMPMRLSILGATGSVGGNTLDVVSRDPSRFSIVALTANRNARDLAGMAIRFKAEFAAVADETAYGELKERLAGTGIRAGAGLKAVEEAARLESDMVVAAIVGAAGLRPTLAAVEMGKTVALANKECLVCAGRLFMDAVRQAGATILPTDSEHNAIFQVLETANVDQIEKVILTASGGPFRTFSRSEMRDVTPAQALKHPNWAMGQRISIDSATMMNKGFEVIEAHHLYDLEAGRLEVLVHPQSVVHGLVQYRDGSLLAQLGPPDMRTPIAHCLAWPRRMPVPAERLDLAALGKLTFETPDSGRFPALPLAYRAMELGTGATAALNAADEIAVEAFLNGAIGFLDIASIVEKILDNMERVGALLEPSNISDVMHLDFEVRQKTKRIVGY